MTFEYHECANIFPMMEYAEHQQMCEDIRENGLRETIKMFEGKIIDGRNRYKACLEVGVSPRTETVETNDPVSYVVSLNLHRRHLNAGQRALVAASAIDVFRKRAKASQAKGYANLKNSAKSNDLSVVPKMERPVETCRANSSAAKTFGVSTSYIGAAVAVKKRAIPEVQQAVLSGSIKLSRAEEISKLTEPEQKSTLAQSTQRKSKVVVDNRTLQQKKEGLPIITNPASSAIQFAKLAIGQLSRIQRSDKGRKEAFQLVINWIKTHE